MKPDNRKRFIRALDTQVSDTNFKITFTMFKKIIKV